MKQLLLNKLSLRVMMLVAFVCVAFTGAWADSETIVFGNLGLENGVQYPEPFGTNISVTFGGGGNDGKYYDSGTGIRTYGDGTITITANGNTITAIETTFASDNYAPASADVWTSDGTGSGTAGASASWEGTATEVVMTRPTGSGHWRLQAITVTYSTDGTPSCATPTFSPAAGTYITAQSVTISTTTEGATIYYTVDGTEPTTESTAYTEAITVSETTTIKAIAVKEDFNNSSVASATYKIVSFEHAGTATDPYTVADARLAIETGVGVSEVYATGIVSKIVTAYNSTYGNITYNISADGTTEGEQLQAFRAKGKNGDWFTSEYDILVGDEVVIFGNLKKYNTTYEFDADNQLVSLKRQPVEITVGESGYATMYLPFAVKFDGMLPSNDLPIPVGEWTFDDPENPLSGSGLATLTPANHSTAKPTWIEQKESLEAAGIEVIDGGLYLPKGSSLVMDVNNGATGFDKYTVMFDISSDDLTGYTPLWQNSMQNAKDGSLFIKNGQVGLGGSLGYNGNLTTGQWYRVVLVIDTPNKAALYIDGELISSCEHTDSYNKHWLLQEPGAVFFADEDGEEKAIKVTGLSFWDVPLTMNQVATLGTVSGEAETGLVKVPETVGVWNFDDAENLTAGTGVSTMTATSGVVANEDGSVTVPIGDALQVTTNLGEDLDTYTLMMDVKLPDVVNYTTLIQTDLDNVEDGCLFVRRGEIGINSGGLYYHGTLESDTWYRITFVVEDLIAAVYVNGVLVGKGSSQLAKWGIGSGFLLFRDEEADSDEGVVTTTEIRLWNQALTPAQVALLGAVGDEPYPMAYTGLINGEYLTLNEVQGTIPAFTPVVLKAAPNTYVYNMAEGVEPIEANDLKGTLEDIDATGKYVLAQPEGEQVGFYLANSGTIAAGKAYLENASGVKAFYFGSPDGSTGIGTIDNGQMRTENGQSAIYNLAGQRLQKMQRGINIVNGKKVLVK